MRDKDIIVLPVEGKGRGVRALRDIDQDEVLEVAHVVPVPHEPTTDHHFWWGDDMDCMAMGKVSFVNHSDDPNCYLEHDFEALTISLVAGRPIKAAEELTYDYDVPLWWITDNDPTEVDGI